MKKPKTIAALSKICNTCLCELPSESFYGTDKYLSSSCKQCHNAACLVRYYKNMSTDMIACRSCGKPAESRNKQFCNDCLLVKEQSRKQSRLQIVEELINKYGGCCSCCGETCLEFLTIDHINNDGYLERQGTKAKGGYRFYSDLLKIPIRNDLQVLCFNCNCGKQRNGGICPHLSVKSDSDIQLMQTTERIVSSLPIFGAN